MTHACYLSKRLTKDIQNMFNDLSR